MSKIARTFGISISKMNDPIADMLTRLRNGALAGHRYVDIPHSKMSRSIAEVLFSCRFIAHLLKGEKRLRLFLKYRNRNPYIQGLKRISKLGCRRYVGYKKLNSVGEGIAILSTSVGILDHRQAHRKGVGGEFLCRVW